MKTGIIKSIAAVAALIIASATVLMAQNGVVTPYSRYGYGLLSDNASAAQRQMGGVGYAMASGRQINVMNPASYARIDSLTFLFDMGVTATQLWQKETVGGAEVSDATFGGGLDYVTMQFPLSKRMGMSIGLLPFSSVGYAFGNDIAHGTASRQGSGSINELYAGVAYRPWGGLSFGFNIAYLFGTIFNDTYAITSSGSTSLYERQLEVRDWYLNIGAQYVQRIGKTDRLTLGLTFSPGKDLHGNTRTYYYDIDKENPEASGDNPLAGRYSFASSWGAGVSYEWRSRLLVEADFTYQPWSNAKYLDINNNSEGVLTDRYKIAVGLQWQPNPRGSYLRRIQYRLGGNYVRDYIIVKGNNVRQYGVSMGFGFPVPGFKSVVNLGVSWLRRQATPSPLIHEDYLQISLGVNFNEMWFRKNKLY